MLKSLFKALALALVWLSFVQKTKCRKTTSG